MNEAAETSNETVVETPTQVDQSPSEGFSVPEGYKDKGWAENIKSHDDLWNQLSNAQSMIGRKTVPDADAPDDQWNEFYKTLGRPDDPTGYELKNSFEGAPEDFDFTPFKEKAATLSHKIGLTPRQAEQLWDGFIGMELEAFTESKASNEAREKELDDRYSELSNSLFGEKFGEVSEQAQKYLSDVLPPELNDAVKGMVDNPEALLAMIKVASHAQDEIRDIKKQYGAEDSLHSGTQAAAASKDDIVSKLASLRSEISGLDPFSPERKAKLSEVDNLRSQLQGLAK